MQWQFQLGGGGGGGGGLLGAAAPHSIGLFSLTYLAPNVPNYCPKLCEFLQTVKFQAALAGYIPFDSSFTIQKNNKG